MSSAPDALATHKGEICIDASQLRPGVHVRLPVGWMDHPFMFNSFVIADEEQARLVAALKLPQLFCNPARCKVPPRPRKEAATAPEDPQSAAEQQQLAALAATRMAEKRETAPVMPAATVPLAPQSAVEPQSTAEQQELAALAAMCMAEQHDPAQVMRELRGRLDKAQVHYFPDRLSIGEIPLAARIVAIADRFDNLVNPVDSRCMMSPSEVLSIKVERPLRLQERPAEELNYLLPRRNLSWSYMAESVSAVG